MNVDVTRAGYDSFGPPSEPVSIRKFLDDTASLDYPWTNGLLTSGWQSLPADERAVVEAECTGSIAELKATVDEVWNNPMLSAHLSRADVAAVDAVHRQAGGPAPKGRKRKLLPNPETAEAQPEVRALQDKLDAISLRCWGLNQDAAFFVRASKHADFNALKCVKKSGSGTLIRSSRPPPGSSSTSASALGENENENENENDPGRDALVTFTVHNRVPWIHSQLTRFSQHVVLSSQTLADLVHVIPCDSNEMPNEILDDAQVNVVGYAYESEDQRSEEGCLLLIEDVVYGDGRPGDDYADKLLVHLQGLRDERRPQITKSPTSLSQTSFASLTPRINQPYWMLHRGNCEHFIVFDQIRLAHPQDPSSGYPLTVHVTPVLGHFCKACAKVPAVFTVVGDVRLGESPCLICAPCWRNMGPPVEEEAGQVMVVPLVKHHRVWENNSDV